MGGELSVLALGVAFALSLFWRFPLGMVVLSDILGEDSVIALALGVVSALLVGRSNNGTIVLSYGGGGCDSLRYDFFGEASLSKTLASHKKIAGLITQSGSKQCTPETTIVGFRSPPVNRTLERRLESILQRYELAEYALR